MKGNARIVVFVLILAIILAFVLLNMTLFTVKNITVRNKVESPLIDKDKIIEDSGIDTGENIFLMSEKDVISSIELANPYLKVTSIERVFPDSVIIHITVRTPVMSIKMKNSDLYVIIDSSLKILDIVSETDNLFLSSTLVEGLEIENPQEGNTLNKENTFNKKLDVIGYVADHESLGESAFLNFFEKIEFDVDNPDLVYIALRSGVKIVLKGDNDLETQLRSALEKYRYMGEQSYERTSGYIYFKEGAGWSWIANDPY